MRPAPSTQATKALNYAKEARAEAQKATVNRQGLEKALANLKQSVEQAQTSRARAEQAFSNASARQADAQTSAASARLAEDMAYRWAEKLDGPVFVPQGGDPTDDGFYSARFWATNSKTNFDQIEEWYNQIEAWYLEIKNVLHPETLAAWTDFRSTYYGPLPSDPTQDPLGNPPTDGDLYFNTTTNSMRVYDGTNWVGFDGESTYLGLTDTPTVYEDQKYARSTASGVVWDGVSYNDLTDVPTEFPPAAHTHTLSQITDSGDFAAIDEPVGDELYARGQSSWQETVSKTDFERPHAHGKPDHGFGPDPLDE